MRAKISILILISLFLYLGMYTWNWKTGYLDKLAALSGMEFVGWVLAPAKWTEDKIRIYWQRYIYLTNVQKENEELKEKVKFLKQKIIKLRTEAKEAQRFSRLLKFSSSQDWKSQGARIIGRRLSPDAVLKTIFINKGSQDGIFCNMPVIIPNGLVGKTFKVSPHYSIVLLMTDQNSKIPVIAETTRTNGIISGLGKSNLLEVKYIPKNSNLFVGERLYTSGLADIFPKGLPVAEVEEINESNLSLFKKVYARPLINFNTLEEVLLIMSKKTAKPELQDMNPDLCTK